MRQNIAVIQAERRYEYWGCMLCDKANAPLYNENRFSDQFAL